MKNELVISSFNVLGGSPRLSGRRLDVQHVIWGITKYDNYRISSYMEDFEVSRDDIRHAIMYCKDEICELNNVLQSCNGCSKKFKKDQERCSDDSFFNDAKLNNVWEVAEDLYNELKNQLDLPSNYQIILNES